MDDEGKMENYVKRAEPTEEVETESGQKRKRERSVVWDHFKKSNDKAYGICNYCGKHLKTAGNTSNLLDHLKRLHPSRMTADKEPMPKTMAIFLNKEPFYGSDSNVKKRLDKKVMNMLSKSVLPFSFVDDEGFVELMQEAVPRYKVPSRMYFRDVMLPTEYEQLSLKLRAALETVKHVGLTTDLWTSAANEGYITITCHYITENFKLTSALLSTAPLITPTNHNAQNIAHSISSMLAKWGLLSKVVTVTTDNDTTMKKACDILAFKHLPCLAHTINLLAQDILKLAAVNGIISKCKRIVTYFKQSTIATAKLKEVQNTNQPLVLIQEVSTRWNSAHAMIKRILQINEYVTLTLLKLRNGPSPITTEELEVLDDLSDLLSPFQEATLSVSTNTKVSVSLMIPVIAEIHHKMNQLNAKLRTQEGKDIYDLVKKRLVERLDTFETRTIPRIATLVDPRFKKDGFLRPSNADQAAKALELELLSFKSTTPRRPPTPPEPTSNEPNFRFSFLQNKSKVKSTRADAIITTRQFMEKENAPCTCDPLKYWEMTDDNDLKLVAKKYFCVQASSCESERVFSKAGQVVSDRRTRLTPEVVDQLLFLNKNRHLNDLK